jgi:hypothetical protein
VGAAGAALGAFALQHGVDARETAPEGVQGHQVDATTSMMTLATQGEAHYATPVGVSARTLIAGSFSGANWPADASMEAYCESFVNETIDRMFPQYDPAYPVKTLTVRPTGDGREVWEIHTVYDPPPLQTVLIEPGQWLGEIRPITDAPAFLSEPL